MTTIEVADIEQFRANGTKSSGFSKSVGMSFKAYAFNNQKRNNVELQNDTDFMDLIIKYKQLKINIY